MAKTRRGFEGQIFIGTAGSTAATQLLNLTDIGYDVDSEKAEDTVRGAGVDVPIVTEHVVGLKPTITFTMMAKDDDTALVTLVAACRTGAAVAMRTKAYATGLGYDGDVTGKANFTGELKGMQQYEFEFTAHRELRTPQLNV
jgi:hypothetical protein